MSPTSRPADTDYIGADSHLTVTWKHVFIDSHAGIAKFTISIGNVVFVDSYASIAKFTISIGNVVWSFSFYHDAMLISSILGKSTIYYSVTSNHVKYYQAHKRWFIIGTYYGGFDHCLL